MLSSFPPEMILQEYSIAAGNRPRNYKSALVIAELLGRYDYTLYVLGPADYAVSATFPLSFWLQDWRRRRVPTDITRVQELFDSVCDVACLAIELLALHKDEQITRPTSGVM